MSNKIVLQILIEARDYMQEHGWANYARKRNLSGSVCVLEAFEAVTVGGGFKNSAKQAFQDANSIVSIINWNDTTKKRTKRDVIKAFNKAIEAASVSN